MKKGTIAVIMDPYTQSPILVEFKSPTTYWTIGTARVGEWNGRESEIIASWDNMTSLCKMIAGIKEMGY
jgi:hypothetical protein